MSINSVITYKKVTITKVTDNKIIASLRMIAVTQCTSKMSSYQDRGQGYRHDAMS